MSDNDGGDEDSNINVKNLFCFLYNDLLTLIGRHEIF